MIHNAPVSKTPRFVVPLAMVMMLTAVVDARAQWIQAQQILPPPAQQNLAPPAAPPSSAPPASVQAGPAPPAGPVQPPANPGLVEEIGKLIRNSASGLSSTLKGSQQTIDNLNNSAKDAAKGATDAILSTTSQTVVNGRTACPIAGNGAPDCKSASDQLCKAKGYKGGTSVDIETAETCSAKVYISGRTGAPGECKTQNFVTRAVCQ
jgi:hypothetical protein